MWGHGRTLSSWQQWRQASAHVTASVAKHLGWNCMRSATVQQAQAVQLSFNVAAVLAADPLCTAVTDACRHCSPRPDGRLGGRGRAERRFLGPGARKRHGRPGAACAPQPLHLRRKRGSCWQRRRGSRHAAAAAAAAAAPGRVRLGSDSGRVGAVFRPAAGEPFPPAIWLISAGASWVSCWVSKPGREAPASVNEDALGTAACGCWAGLQNVAVSSCCQDHSDFPAWLMDASPYSCCCRSGLEEFYDARSRRASLLSSGGSSACESSG